MIHSLAMTVERIDGMYVIDAPWLREPVSGVTWPEAYEKALRGRRS